MANRVNTKFVIILCVVLGTIPVAGGAVWYYRNHIVNSPEKLVARGDQFLQQGNIDKAIEQYGRALNKRSGDTDLLMKYAQTIQKFRTDDQRVAGKQITQVIASLDKIVLQEPDHDDAFVQLMEIYAKLAQDLHDFQAWTRMYERAQTRLEANPEHTLARKYRGLAQVHRIERLNLNPEQRAQALSDVQAALVSLPDDPALIRAAAKWHLLEAEPLDRPSGNPEKARELRDQGAAITAAAADAHPDDVMRQLDHLETLAGAGEAFHDHAMALAEQIESQLLESPTDAKTVLRLAQTLPVLDRKIIPPTDDNPRRSVSGLVRAELLLSTALETQPDNIQLAGPLARALEIQQKYEDALPLYKMISESEGKSDLFEALILSQLRASATLKYAGTLLRTSQGLPEPERTEALDTVRDLTDGIVTNIGESAESNLILGKLAVAHEQWDEALAKLDKACLQFNDTNPEALLLSAQARVRIGELGAAAKRLERLTELRPTYAPARYELAGMYLRMSQLPQAKKQIDYLLDADPDDTQARRLRGELLARSGDVSQALEVYEGIDDQDDPAVIRQRARLLYHAGDQDQAIRLLEAGFEKHPTDISLLYDLVKLSDDAERAGKYLERARDAGVAERVIDVLEKTLAGVDEVAEMVEQIIDTDEDPMSRHLKRYELFRRLRKNDKAAAELDAAEQINPDHPLIISVRFNDAIESKQWAAATELAERAGEKRLDKAEGMFFLGRLNAARGEAERAIANYKRGLRLRPIYSDGWRMLGDAQRLAEDVTQAVEAYNRSLEQRPDNIDALRGLAMCNDTLGNHDAALAHLTRAVKLRPNDRRLHAQLLDYEGEHGDSEKALAARRKLAEDNPDNTPNRRALALLLMNMDRLDQAQGVIDQLIEDEGSTRANVFTAARIHAAKGDPQTGRHLLQAYVNHRAEQATDQDWIALARFMLDHDMEEEGLAAYRQGTEVEDTTLRQATRELADLLFERNRMDEAVIHYEKLWQTHAEETRIGHRLIEALIRADMTDRAKEILSDVTARHGEGADTAVLGALLAKGEGDTEQAIKSLTIAIDLDPRRAVFYYQRAKIRSDDPLADTEVIADLIQSLELDPTLSSARILLATIHMRRGERTEAANQYANTIKHNPEHVQARLRLAQVLIQAQQWSRLRTLLQESVELYPKSGLWLRLQAQQAFREGDKTTAIDTMHKALTLAPTIQTLAELITMHLDSNQADHALLVLRDHSQLVSNDPSLQALRGRTLVQLNRLDPASASFSKAASLCKTYREIGIVIAHMSESIGRERTWEQLTNIPASQRTQLIDLAIAQIEVERTLYADAVVRLERLGPRIPSDAPHRQNYNMLLGLSLQQTGRHQDSLTAYRAALEARPDDLVVLNNIAYLLAESLDRAPEAVPLAQRAADLAPRDPLILDTLGWVLFKSDLIEQAKSILQRSIEIKALAPNCYHLAEVLIARGDQRQASVFLEQAIDLARKTADDKVLQAATKRLEEISR